MLADTPLAYLARTWPDVLVVRYRTDRDAHAVLGIHERQLILVLHPDLEQDEEDIAVLHITKDLKRLYPVAS